MVEFVFLDLDDTILDFHSAERSAIRSTLKSFGLEPTEEVLALYHQINKEHWEKLERGELTREQVLTGRFAVLFEKMQVSADAGACRSLYMENLSRGHDFLPGAEEAVASLSKKYRLFLASNGTAFVQHRRLTEANLYRYFEQIFISEEMGINKPDKGYFDLCFRKIPGFAPERAIMVGDSLTSDILGGLRAGLTTCWVNPGHRTANPEIRPDYEIGSLTQLEGLLETL